MRLTCLINLGVKHATRSAPEYRPLQVDSVQTTLFHTSIYTGASLQFTVKTTRRLTDNFAPVLSEHFDNYLKKTSFDSRRFAKKMAIYYVSDNVEIQHRNTVTLIILN